MKFLFNFLIISFSFLSIIFSQEKLKFEHFTLEHGLSHPTAQTIMQDDKGFLWIGTKDGLNKFDGYRVYNSFLNEKDSNSISDNFIRTIFQDISGNIWIGTSRGLNKLFIKKNDKSISKKFIRFLKTEGDSTSISNDDVRTIYQTKNSDLWIGTSDGLNKISANQFEEKNNDNYSFKRYTDFTNNIITSIAEDNDENLWIGTLGGGLNKLNIKTGEFFNYYSEEKNSNSISSNYIMCLYHNNNILWIGTYNGGLIKYAIKDEKFTIYNSKHNLSDNRIFAISEDKEGNLWLATFGGGLNKFNPRSEKFDVFKNDIKNDGTIRNNFVRSVFLDNSNNLWVGTNESLEKTSLNPLKFYHYKNNPWDSNSLQDNHVLSVLEDHQENIWIGSNKGLDKFNFKTNQFFHYKIDHKTLRSEGGFIQAIYEDKAKDLWIGTFGGGLFKYNKITNNFKQYKNDPSDPGSIIDNRVISINEDQSGNILIGSNNGICRLDKTTDKFSNFIYSKKDSAILAGKRINVIYRDKQNSYWIGLSEGVIKIEKDDTFIKYFYNENDPASIAKGNINSICEDSQGNMWIGSDYGLSLLLKNNKTFIKFSTDDGFQHNGIVAVVEDDFGNIWVSSQKGLTKFIYKNGSISELRNYDVNDGLGNFDFNDNSVFKGSNGKILFGGMNGLSIIFPELIRDNKYIPPIAITSFKKFDREILSSDELSVVNELELSYTDKYFSFEFASLDFTSPEKNKYAYKLEGFDEDWNYISDRRFASYTNLDPGKYIFRVKGSNNDGIWNEEGASLILTIAPPFYKTWWAYTSYMILIILFLLSLRRYEMNKRRKKEEERLRIANEEAQLREVELRAETAELKAKAMEAEKEMEKQQIRNRIAADLHDEIGSNLSSIILLSSALKDSDNINSSRRYIADINYAAKFSADAIRDIVWFINPDSDQMDKLLIKMKETANRMLLGLKYNFTAEGLKNTEGLNPDFKRNIYLIYKEILTNITKHSGSDEVEIVIKEDNNKFFLFIKDNGKGFNVNDATNGNGLTNLRTRTSLIDGKIDIKSMENCGTEIFLEVKIT